MKELFKLISKLIQIMFEVIFTIVLIGLGLFIDARYIEPKLLIVNEQRLTSKGLTLEEPLRIVQFSDVHLGENYSLNDFKRVVDKINGLQPDLIIFTGDLIDDHKTFQEVEGTVQLLKELTATYGKYAVIGNHDHGGNGTNRYKKMMKDSQFTLLVNEESVLTLKNGEKLSIVGVDDIVLGHPDFEAAFENSEVVQYRLFISHAPDVGQFVADQKIDLQLSGHSHGGQVRLPIIGAPFTVPYGKQYVKGLYEVTEKEDMFVYVSSGIGTSQLPYRFLNPPEITLFLIENKK